MLTFLLRTVLVTSLTTSHYLSVRQALDLTLSWTIPSTEEWRPMIRAPAGPPPPGVKLSMVPLRFGPYAGQPIVAPISPLYGALPVVDPPTP